MIYLNIILPFVLGVMIGFSCISAIVHRRKLKEMQEELNEIVEALKRADKKVKGLEEYLGVKYVQKTSTVTLKPIEIKDFAGGAKVEINNGHFDIKTVPAHYEHVKVEESKAMLMDAIKSDKAKAKSDKLKKAWVKRKKLMGKNK